MPRINLLPWREQQRTERKRSFVLGMFVAGLAAVAVMGAGFLLMNALIEAQGSRNQRLGEEIKILDKRIEEINSLEQQKQQHIARMQIIEKLQRSRSEIVHVFDTLVTTVPDGIYLTSIVQNGQKFKIQGVTQSASRVSAFMRALDASEWLKQPELERLAAPDNNPLSNSFSMEAVQVTSLSNDPAPAAAKKTGAKK